MGDLVISPFMFGITSSVFPLWVRVLEAFATPLEIDIEITSTEYRKTTVLWMYKEHGRKATLKFKGKPFSTEQLIVALLGDRHATRSLLEGSPDHARAAMSHSTLSKWHKESHSDGRPIGLALSAIFSKRTELQQEVTADDATRLSLGILGGKETGARIKFTIKGREQFCRQLIQQMLMSKNVLFSAFFGSDGV